ncbi:quinone oxidoreductase family protein [Chryseobacterium gambrini]|uniref:NADPH2:quinone reductase n=1 Tax=Chryseobacterium gambrini TaxID=373672 RepID=A0A1N7MKM8_9FLAO|nr:quinone oxidoreductase [Chryseobacterium gambrini]SIS86548.1 NADPH2:quinone reductase [Chryseobacterium gambrini]
MKVSRFHQNGNPDVLVYEEIETPKPNAGEVLIKIESVGVNYADTIRRRGDNYPEPSPVPFILGIEVAGTIEELGEGVDNLAIGTRVFAIPGSGGYAQYIPISATAVIPLPESIDFDTAAAILAHGLTAMIVLQKAAKIQRGETILIEGAAGGLGLFAVQIAKIFGAVVIAAASTEEKRKIAIDYGADFAIDYTQADWSQKVIELTDGKGVDVIWETTGGEAVNQALDALAVFGRMIYLGQSSGQSASIDPWRLTAPNHTITGIYINNYSNDPVLIGTALQELMGYVISGEIKVEAGHILPLSQASEAHMLLENRKNIGKIVLKPWKLIE